MADRADCLVLKPNLFAPIGSEFFIFLEYSFRILLNIRSAAGFCQIQRVWGPEVSRRWTLGRFRETRFLKGRENVSKGGFDGGEGKVEPLPRGLWLPGGIRFPSMG
jgi:hypothetical protein